MLKQFLVLTLAMTMVSGQTWVSRARLRNHITYWHTLVQEMINELERREWCNLKLNDITQTIDDNLFNMRVTGSVTYTEGFVVSIQKIDMVNIEQLITSRTIDGELVPFGTVRGQLNFRDIMVGYNMYANLTSPAGEYRSTGTFLHTLVQIQLHLTQNLLTKELASNPSVNTVSGGSGVRMQYMPASNITEAIGRRFWSSTFASAENWAMNIFAPIILDLAATKFGFPEVCYNNCL